MSLQRASRTLARTRSGKLLAASGVLDQIISDHHEPEATLPPERVTVKTRTSDSARSA